MQNISPVLLDKLDAFVQVIFSAYFSLLSAAGAMAVTPVPSSSIISILVVLSSIGIETHNVGLLMALEWYK